MSEEVQDLSVLWAELGQLVKRYEEEGWTQTDIKHGMEAMWDGIELEETNGHCHTSKEDIRCPECGSTEWMLDIVDWNERCVYVFCKECHQQWNIGPA